MARRKEPIILKARLHQPFGGADAKTAIYGGCPIDQLKKALAERALNAEIDHDLSSEEASGNGLRTTADPRPTVRL